MRGVMRVIIVHLQDQHRRVGLRAIASSCQGPRLKAKNGGGEGAVMRGRVGQGPLTQSVQYVS